MFDVKFPYVSLFKDAFADHHFTNVHRDSGLATINIANEQDYWKIRQPSLQCRRQYVE
jgi:hypothetical protein